MKNPSEQTRPKCSKTKAFLSERSERGNLMLMHGFDLYMNWLIIMNALSTFKTVVLDGVNGLNK